MPSFLLLGGPISAFFAGLTAELHYCTFYSPFPSYKWKKNLLLSFSGLAVLTNGVILIVQTSLMGSPSENASSIYAPWVSYFFVACKYIMYNIRGFSSWLLKIVLFPYCILFCFSNSTSSRLVSALTHTIYFHASFVSLFWVVWHLKMESRCRCLRRACNFPRGFPIDCLLDDFQSIINRLNVFSPRNIGLFRWLSQFSIIFFILFF